MSMWPKVCILGCGPAGLLAAHAAELAGAEPHIYSKKNKSLIHGAQFLHESIPETSPRSAPVIFDKIGSGEIYQMKVYGNMDVSTSWDKFPVGIRRAYSMQDLYDQLWERYQDLVREVEVTESLLTELEEAHGYDLLISTVPRYLLCSKGHTFVQRKMYIVETTDVPTVSEPENVIVYNGDPMSGWYRFSRLFGHSFLEFGQDTQNHSGVEGIKIIGHECDCRPRWHCMGRYGKWQRGVLAHEAFKEAKDALYAL
jgi:hypothetical protein